MKRLALLTSGGDSPGMNAAIRAVVRYSLFHDIEVFGVLRGYQGLINGNLKQMNVKSVGDIIHRGGTILRSARCEEFKTSEGQEKALNILELFKIDGLIIIGGDGSFKGGKELANKNFPVVCIPATIDNDLAYTDYTIGFDTAVNTILGAISNLRDTISSHERVSVIEVMGRNSGDLALFAGLAGGAEEIIIPEKSINIHNICERIIFSKNRGKTQSIILVAEGAKLSYKEIAKLITEKTGIETRTTKLGHIQRGGTPSSFDRILAARLSKRAIDLLLENNSKKAVGIKNNNIIDLDILEALKIKKVFNNELYNLDKMLSV